MSASVLAAMTPTQATLAAAIVMQQQQQATASVVEALGNETGGAGAPVVSSSVSAPGALEIFA